MKNFSFLAIFNPQRIPYFNIPDITPIETQSSAAVPFHNDLKWSQMALAADIADESLRAARMAAPLFWTHGINSFLIQLSSLSAS